MILEMGAEVGKTRMRILWGFYRILCFFAVLWKKLRWLVLVSEAGSVEYFSYYELT